MNKEQEQKIVKFLQQINNDIRRIDGHIGSADGVSAHLRAARFEIIEARHLFKLGNEKKNVKEETIQHKIE